MKIARISIVIAVLWASVAANKALGQGAAYGTPLASAIAFQNVGSAPGTIKAQYFTQGSGTPLTTTTSTLNPGAGSSLFVGNQSGGAYIGSSRLSADQPLTAIVVQVPESSAVKSRPVSSLFRVGSSRVLLATVLKNKFNTNTLFSIQNVAGVDVDFVVKIFDADNPSSSPYTTLTRNDVPPGASYFFDMGNSQSVTGLPTVFNGSVVAEGYKTDANHSRTIPAPIVGSANEMMTSGYGARAFEGVPRGGTKLFMATALCDAFGGIRTAYAVQNVSESGNASVVVKYYATSGSASGSSSTIAISAGTKVSFQTCTDKSAGFSGSAVIESTGGNIIAVGKATKNSSSNNPDYGTAFIGVTYGSSKLSLPYVRWTSDSNYNNTAIYMQRVYLAIQNVGSSTISNVQVKYINTHGTVVGTHTISSIAPYAKQNSNASLATPSNSNNPSVWLQEFGYPASNGNTAYGGAVIIEGAGEMIAIGRVQSMVDVATSKDVAEDYSAIPLP